MKQISTERGRTRSDTYGAIHIRLRKYRGRARWFLCTDCGKQAAEWSWVHDTDPADLRNYKARCHSCHKVYDDIGKGPSPAKSAFAKARERDDYGHFV
jgi:hypothetical protein